MRPARDSPARRVRSRAATSSSPDRSVRTPSTGTHSRRRSSRVAGSICSWSRRSSISTISNARSRRYAAGRACPSSPSCPSTRRPRRSRASPHARGASRRSRATRAAPSTERTELQRLFDDGIFVVSVQLDPPLGANPEALIETARAVRDTNKAQFVDVNDNPRARARMSGIMASVAIERFTGVETIPHLTPRDMTLTGLESILLGAHAEGVRNILAVTGDPPEAGDYPGRGGVYEVDAIGLVDLLARLNRGEDHHGRAIDAPTSFFPGVAVIPTADDRGLEAERFHRKVAAGARLALTPLPLYHPPPQ